jgi:hypothetical protein
MYEHLKVIVKQLLIPYSGVGWTWFRFPAKETFFLHSNLLALTSPGSGGRSVVEAERGNKNRCMNLKAVSALHLAIQDSHSIVPH